jgi:hypothetical protein
VKWDLVGFGEVSWFWAERWWVESESENEGGVRMGLMEREKSLNGN